ncbi:MAG: DUF5916 domain-containing protein [Acidobacteriota bacterium]
MRAQIFIIFFALLFSFNFGQEQKKGEKVYPPAKNFKVVKAVSKISIDGVLNEEAWKHPEKIGIDYEWSPGDAVKPPVKTDVLVTFDEKNFYIAFVCYDPDPSKIRAHLMDRDSINTFIQDDHISFMVDTFNDERRAFQFRVNPLGVQADAIFSEMEGYEDFSWDAIWRSAGKITDFGYVVEVAIPLNQLRFPKDKGVQTWGIEADRSYPRNVRHRMSTHVRDRNKNCILCQFNKATGFEGLSPGKNLEFSPTLTMLRTDKIDEFPNGNLQNGKVDTEPGISAKWGVTSNMTLNAAINPDFSQIEADVRELEVNTRYAVRYPEKRPFFLEGADYFLTPLEAIFTRTVFDPYWGGKLTGKIGKNAVGFYTTRDKFNNLLIPSNQGSVSLSLKEDVFNGVFRYRRDLGRGSALGMLYTGRAGDEYSNHVAGFDGFFRLSRSKTINVQYLRSQTEYPDEIVSNYGQEEGNFGGNAIMAEFTHFSRNLFYRVLYTDLSSGFRADSGFIPRVDYRRIDAMVSPVIWGKRGSWFNRIAFTLRGWNVTDQEGNMTDQKLYLNFTYQGPLQTAAQTALNLSKEVYKGETFNVNYMQFFAEMKPRGGLAYYFYTRFGDAIDYTNTRLGNSLQLNPGIELGLGRHFNMNLSHVYEKMNYDGNKVYTANLLQTKLIYNLNIRTFLRAIVQFTDIDRNTGLYLVPIEERTKAIFTQFLFSYKINPQTVLFLGYSDNQYGMKGIDLTRADRTFFLKIGYALAL